MAAVINPVKHARTVHSKISCGIYVKDNISATASPIATIETPLQRLTVIHFYFGSAQFLKGKVRRLGAEKISVAGEGSRQ